MLTPPSELLSRTDLETAAIRIAERIRSEECGLHMPRVLGRECKMFLTGIDPEYSSKTLQLLKMFVQQELNEGHRDGGEKAASNVTKNDMRIAVMRAADSVIASGKTVTHKKLEMICRTALSDEVPVRLTPVEYREIVQKITPEVPKRIVEINRNKHISPVLSEPKNDHPTSKITNVASRNIAELIPLVDIAQKHLEQTSTAPESPNEKGTRERIARLTLYRRLLMQMQLNIPSVRKEAETLELRPNQFDTMQDIISFLGKAGNDDDWGYVVEPPAAGKTVTYALLARLTNVRTLVLMPFTNLLDQTKKTFSRLLGIPESEMGIVGGKRKEFDNHITFTTYQGYIAAMKTPERRAQLSQSELIIFDEGHMALGDVTQEQVEAMAEFEEDALREACVSEVKKNAGGALKIGFTGTPVLTKKNMQKTFHHLIHRESYSRLIRSGILPKFKILPLQAYVGAGEIEDTISAEQEVELLNREQIYEKALHRLLKLKTEVSEPIHPVAFCSSIRECDAFSKMAASLNIRCEIVTSREYTKAPNVDHIAEAERRLIESGETDVIVSVDKMQLGWDCPDINTVLLLRATLSPAIPPQEAGRASRQLPGKQFAYIIEPQWKSSQPSEPSFKLSSLVSGLPHGKQKNTERAPRQKFVKQPLTLAAALHALGEQDLEHVCEGLHGERISYSNVHSLGEDGTVKLEDGRMGVGISAFVVAHPEFDYSGFDDAIRGAGLTSIGFALNRSRYVEIFDFDEVQALPYVQERMTLQRYTREDPKVVIDGEECMSARMFALYGAKNTMDVSVLVKHIKKKRIKPRGTALSPSKTADMYAVRDLRSLPFVQERSTYNRVDPEKKTIPLQGKRGVGISGFVSLHPGMSYASLAKGIATAKLKPIGYALGSSGKIPVYEEAKLLALPYVKEHLSTKVSLDPRTGATILGNKTAIGLSAFCTANPKLAYATLKRAVDAEFESIGTAFGGTNAPVDVYDLRDIATLECVRSALGSNIVKRVEKKLHLQHSPLPKESAPLSSVSNAPVAHAKDPVVPVPASEPSRSSEAPVPHPVALSEVTFDHPSRAAGAESERSMYTLDHWMIVDCRREIGARLGSPGTPVTRKRIMETCHQVFELHRIFDQKILAEVIDRMLILRKLDWTTAEQESSAPVPRKNVAASAASASPPKRSFYPGESSMRPSNTQPGSEGKILDLAARYESGLPLWHAQDNEEHGPPEEQLAGTESAALPVLLDGRSMGDGAMDTAVPPAASDEDGHRVDEILNQVPRELLEEADSGTAIVQNAEHRSEVD